MDDEDLPPIPAEQYFRDFFRHLVEIAPEKLSSTHTWAEHADRLEHGANPRFLELLCQAGVIYDGTRFHLHEFTHGYASKDEALRHLEYGVVDFAIGGFAAIRNAFAKSVIAIEVSKNDDLDIGTAFLINNQTRLATAAHNLLDGDGFRPILEGGNTVVAAFVHEHLDLAMLDVSHAIPGRPFETSTGEVLDDVLVMGFPRISGYDIVQTAERAQVVALKSTTGQVVARGTPYLDPVRTSRLLVSARVKGGHSGGPVIDRSGRVMGVVERQEGSATASDDNPLSDVLGYATAIPLSEKFYDGSPLRFLRRELASADGWWSIVD